MSRKRVRHNNIFDIYYSNIICIHIQRDDKCVQLFPPFISKITFSHDIINFLTIHK